MIDLIVTVLAGFVTLLFIVTVLGLASVIWVIDNL